ncbi:MAG: transposase [Desulfobacterales bacterium]
MGFKKGKRDLSFAEFSLKSSMNKNRSLERLLKINRSLDWDMIERLLVINYNTGRSKKGAGAYSPLLLFKCLLLQKWFRIDSDFELECHINDRISFKKFIGIPFTDPSPAQKTFSRFRKRLTKKALEHIYSDISRQFEKKGLAVTEGMAVDPKLAKLQRHPVTKEKEAQHKINFT